jgi:hypothetical protein
VRTFFSRHRLTVFRVLAVLAGLLFLLANIPVAISPWGPVTLQGGNEGVRDLNLHRWSAGLAGGPDIGAAAVLFYVAWRPLGSQLILQFIALAMIVFFATQVPFIGPLVILIALPFLLVLAAYPQPSKLLEAPWRDGVSPPRLALAVLISVFLLPDAAAALLAQVRGADELAARYNWASNGEHLINLSLAALLASMRQPGAVALALMVGGVLTYLGAAAIAVPTNAGSWGMIGGMAAIVVGIAFAAIAAYEGRRSAAGERSAPTP